jgi:hypothetical protein
MHLTPTYDYCDIPVPGTVKRHVVLVIKKEDRAFYVIGEDIG